MLWKETVNEEYFLSGRTSIVLFLLVMVYEIGLSFFSGSLVMDDVDDEQRDRS